MRCSGGDPPAFAAARPPLLSMEIVRHLLAPVAASCIGGLVASGSLIATNPSLRGLIVHTQSGWLGGVLLAVGFVTTFGAVAIAWTIARTERS